MFSLYLQKEVQWLPTRLTVWEKLTPNMAAKTPEAPAEKWDDTVSYLESRHYAFSFLLSFQLKWPVCDFFSSVLLKGRHVPNVILQKYFREWGMQCSSCMLKCELLSWCLTLCDSMNYSLSGSSIPGILHARILEWVAIPFSRGSSWPGDWIQVSCIASRFFII